MPRAIQLVVATFAAALLLAPTSFGFNSPLSDEAIREAYFLGQRHDGSFLEPYVKFLPLPKTGPHIASVTFLTPFAQFAQFCNTRIGNYSAQQALLDHHDQPEFVKISVEIHLTASYGALVPAPGEESKSSPNLVPRRYDFWKDFRVQVSNEGKILSPSSYGGHPLYRCGRYGPCRPMGAAIEMELPLEAFDSGSTTVEVIPPEGDPVSVEFDLTRLR